MPVLGAPPSPFLAEFCHFIQRGTLCRGLCLILCSSLYRISWCALCRAMCGAAQYECGSAAQCACAITGAAILYRASALHRAAIRARASTRRWCRARDCTFRLCRAMCRADATQENDRARYHNRPKQRRSRQDDPRARAGIGIRGLGRFGLHAGCRPAEDRKSVV